MALEIKITWESRKRQTGLLVFHLDKSSGIIRIIKKDEYGKCPTSGSSLDMASAELAAADYASCNMDCVINVCADTRHAA